MALACRLCAPSCSDPCTATLPRSCRSALARPMQRVECNVAYSSKISVQTFCSSHSGCVPFSYRMRGANEYGVCRCWNAPSGGCGRTDRRPHAPCVEIIYVWLLCMRVTRFPFSFSECLSGHSRIGFGAHRYALVSYLAAIWPHSTRAACCLSYRTHSS